LAVFSCKKYQMSALIFLNSYSVCFKKYNEWKEDLVFVNPWGQGLLNAVMLLFMTWISFSELNNRLTRRLSMSRVDRLLR
jgi:hypothetical protein